MTLQEKIKRDMVNAMRNHKVNELNLLRVILGEISRIDKNISNEQIIKIIRKMHENAKEQNNLIEIEILESYLPKMYSNEDIRILIANIIQGHNFKNMQHLGAIMGILNKHPDKMFIDKKIASEIVKEFLNK